MRRRELIRKLEKAGFQLERHGSRHDVYRRGKDLEQVPRHREIAEPLSKAILRKWDIDDQ